MTRPLTQQEIKTVQVDSLARGPQLVDLQHLSARELEPLLVEQAVEWRLELDWDFSKSADLVRKLTDTRRLRGVALLDREKVAGYGYIGLDDRKGLIADVYVRPGWRIGNTEAAMFRVLLDALIGTSGVRRIESQLMLADAAWAKALEVERERQAFA